MKLRILTRYGRKGASSRVRFLQYLPHLERAGFDVEVAPFFGDDYLEALYAGRGTRAAALEAYGRRVRRLRGARGAIDVIWLEKEALAWVPHAIEAGLMPRGVPVVSDYDDAVFHRYDMHRLPLVRGVLGRKHAAIMARSSCVMAGNAYLAGYARHAGAASVEIVPTVVDADVYRPAEVARGDASPVIGWIGMPSTWADCVAPFLPTLENVARRHGTVLQAIGARPDPAEEGILRFLPWSEAGEVEMIRAMDIGIMPLPDTPWMRGKCGYKLIQYMACGLPVVASPVGVNTEIVQHGVNGFLAETQEDWRKALETLIGDPELRRAMGAAGRRTVERSYSLHLQGPRVASLLKRAAEGGLSGRGNRS
ncbi:glycosyltransferase [Rhodobacterales bacterium HKCCSP123]|nr:glycosyltransferase [Rhodobacterales bacterium HKCCSP123]